MGGGSVACPETRPASTSEKKNLSFTSVPVITELRPLRSPHLSPVSGTVPIPFEQRFIFIKKKWPGGSEGCQRNGGHSLPCLSCYPLKMYTCSYLWLFSLRRLLITKYTLCSTDPLSFKIHDCACNPPPILIVHTCSRL